MSPSTTSTGRNSGRRTRTKKVNIDGRSTAASDQAESSRTKHQEQTVCTTESEPQGSHPGFEQRRACKLAPDSRKQGIIYKELSNLLNSNRDVLAKACHAAAGRSSIEQPPPQTTPLVSQAQGQGICLPKTSAKDVTPASPATRQTSAFRFNVAQEGASQIPFESLPATEDQLTPNNTQEAKEPVSRSKLDIHSNRQSNGAVEEGRIDAVQESNESADEILIDEHDSQESNRPIYESDLATQHTQESQEDSQIEELLIASKLISNQSDQPNNSRGDVTTESIRLADESEPAGSETQELNDDSFIASDLISNLPDPLSRPTGDPPADRVVLESGISLIHLTRKSTTVVAVDLAKETKPTATATSESNKRSQILGPSMNLPTYHVDEPARSPGKSPINIPAQGNLLPNPSKYLPNTTPSEPIEEMELAIYGTGEINGETQITDFLKLSKSISNHATSDPSDSDEAGRSSEDRFADETTHESGLLVNRSLIPGSRVSVEVDEISVSEPEQTQVDTSDNVGGLNQELRAPPEQGDPSDLDINDPLIAVYTAPDSPGQDHRSAQADNESHQVGPMPLPCNDDSRVPQEDPTVEDNPSPQHFPVPQDAPSLQSPQASRDSHAPHGSLEPEPPDFHSSKKHVTKGKSRSVAKSSRTGFGKSSGFISGGSDSSDLTSKHLPARAPQKPKGKISSRDRSSVATDSEEEQKEQKAKKANSSKRSKQQKRTHSAAWKQSYESDQCEQSENGDHTKQRKLRSKRKKTVPPSASPTSKLASTEAEDSVTSFSWLDTTASQQKSRPNSSSSNPRRRDGYKRRRIFWSQDEEKLLINEVVKYHVKPNCMAEILKRHGPRGTRSKTFAHKTNLQLKDKAVNLTTKWQRERVEIPRKVRKAFARFPPKIQASVKIKYSDSEKASDSENSDSDSQSDRHRSQSIDKT